MARSLVVYFLLLLFPLVLLPVGTHRLLSDEMKRGRTVGRTLLRECAQRIALEVRNGQMPDEARCAAEGIQVGILDENGRPQGAPLPADGRCRGEALVGDGRRVCVVWAGVESPGFARAHRLMRCELVVYLVCGFFALLGLGLIIHDIWRVRRESARRLDYVADFSHRLKTPLTSVSLCAELLVSGRLDAKRQAEGVVTIAEDAAKLNGIVDEVLAYVKESRRG